MKVLIICGSYPPIKCGVGDYTYSLAKALANIPDIEVGVLTSTDAQNNANKNDKVHLFPVMANWKLRSLGKIFQVVATYRPDIIHIQYPALGYQKTLMRALPFLLKFKNIPIIQTWHEHLNECELVGWENLLSCKALIYVRQDFLLKLPYWVDVFFKTVPKFFIPNASVITPVVLNGDQILNLKNSISPLKKIVCFFGFANPNKGVERLFDIVDPEKFHLLLICDLSPLNPYQNRIIEKAKETSWLNNLTVTGYLPEQQIGELFSIADAIVFPFPGGAGHWNTSLQAAQASGAFTLATTADQTLIGYNEESNTYFVACDDIGLMPIVLTEYAGRRVAPNLSNEWDEIAAKHVSVYHQFSVV